MPATDQLGRKVDDRRELSRRIEHTFASADVEAAVALGFFFVTQRRKS